jgi:type II secretory pathway component PulM
MSPLVSLTLLGFGALLVLALLVWVLLTPPRPRRERGASPAGRAPATPRQTPVTNDAVRGARVRPPDRPKDDAFERFLHADQDDR